MNFAFGLARVLSSYEEYGKKIKCCNLIYWAMKVGCPINDFYFCSASRNLAGMKGSMNFPFVSTQEIRIIKNEVLFVMTCVTLLYGNDNILSRYLLQV